MWNKPERKMRQPLRAFFGKRKSRAALPLGEGLAQSAASGLVCGQSVAFAGKALTRLARHWQAVALLS